jgi:hypothetical protein
MTEPDLAERLAVSLCGGERDGTCPGIDGGHLHSDYHVSECVDCVADAIREALREAADIAVDEAARRGALRAAKTGTVAGARHLEAKIAAEQIRDRILRLAGEER